MYSSQHRPLQKLYLVNMMGLPVLDNCKSCSDGGKDTNAYETWVPVICLLS